MVGNNTSLIGGLTAATSLFVVNWILKNLIFRSKNLSEMVQGNPLMLVYHGKIIQKHLDQAKLSIDELEAAVREHGVSSVKDVDIVILEVDGNISVLSNNFTRKTTKKRRIHKSLNFTN
ncbi:MAG: YetF domain-containing protein [bacterium]